MVGITPDSLWALKFDPMKVGLSMAQGGTFLRLRSEKELLPLIVAQPYLRDQIDLLNPDSRYYPELVYYPGGTVHLVRLSQNPGRFFCANLFEAA